MSRRERREAQRAQQKIARQRERLFLLGPGGSHERPVDVGSASVIEVHAKATPCPACGGEHRIDSHDAETIDGAALRVVRAHCHQCGAKRAIYFRIVAPN